MLNVLVFNLLHHELHTKQLSRVRAEKFPSLSGEQQIEVDLGLFFQTGFHDRLSARIDFSYATWRHLRRSCSGEVVALFRMTRGIFSTE